MASPADTHNQISSYTIMLNNSELSSEYQLAAIETTKVQLYRIATIHFNCDRVFSEPQLF